MPAVGVVMPTHGRNPHLAAAVASVRAQSFADWTLAIVCDGASDETARLARALAAEDGRIRVLAQPGRGVAAARNRGLDAIRAEVEAVAFLDHDDRWLPGALARLTRALAEGAPDRVGVYGVARFIDEAGALVRPGELEAQLRWRQGVEGDRLVEWALDRPTVFANLAFSSCIPVGTVLVRRQALDRAGRFDERAVPADDYDMWIRLSRLGGFGFVDEVVLEYRQHARPTWVRPHGVGRGAPYVRRKTITSPDNSPTEKAMAEVGFRQCERIVVGVALAEAGRLVGRGRFLAGARRLVSAAAHLGSYVRGVPGPWHA